MNYNIMTVSVNNENIRLTEIEKMMDDNEFGVDDLKKIIHQMNIKLCRLGGGVRTCDDIQVVVRKKSDIMNVMRIVVDELIRLKHPFSGECYENMTKNLWENMKNCKFKSIRIYLPSKDADWGWDPEQSNSRRHAKVIPLNELLDLKGN
jgi:hypothetical protein